VARDRAIVTIALRCSKDINDFENAVANKETSIIVGHLVNLARLRMQNDAGSVSDSPGRDNIS